MKALKFRIQNFRNIDDSDWIPLERVTNFVGRNESGKTTLLKAFHKFNPATPEAYDPQREFPRDRYTRDYVAGGSKGGEWPVCSVSFALPDDLRNSIASVLGAGQQSPKEAILTRYYDSSLSFEYEPALTESGLTDVVGADEHRCYAKADVCLFDAPEAKNAESRNSHGDIWLG